MNTIAIKTNEIRKEDRPDRKKTKAGDSAKAAMATGVAGIAVGVGAKTAADTLGTDTEDNTGATADTATSNTETVQLDNVIAEEAVSEVNPDDVMLEEPVAESTAETDMLAGATPYPGEDVPYRPFTSNDSISDEVLPEPQPDEVLIAENTYSDVIACEDQVVDMICEVSEENQGIPEEVVCPDDIISADNVSPYEDSDIQSDLMA